MPVYQIKRLVRLETLRSINPGALLTLLRPHVSFFKAQGLELPAEKYAARLDLKKLAHILALHELHPPSDLADALYYINEMSTSDGMDALLPELMTEEFALRIFQEGPADVAVRAWLKDHKLVERKHAEIFASRPRRFEYFQSLADPPPLLPELTRERLLPLEAYLDTVFTSKNRGGAAQVMAYPRENDCLFMVRHGEPRRREGALEGMKETSVFYRPLKFDVVGYDALSGALRVYARSDWEISLYRGAFGEHLFGSMDHFPITGRYTLEPLRTGDRACLSCLDASPIVLVYLTEVRLAWGGIYDAVEVHRARDVFAALHQRKAEVPAEPRIVFASFELYVSGDQQPRKVTIIPPNIARYSHEDESQMIDHWLGLRGFIQKRSGSADAPKADTLLQFGRDDHWSGRGVG